MAIPVNLYNSLLFGNADDHCEVRHLNNAPAGVDGVDLSARQVLLAADGADRNHGICCGISVAWLVGLVNGREESWDCGEFQAYFMNVLRFQGAYIKQGHQRGGDFDRLAQHYVHNCVLVSHSGNSTTQQLFEAMPEGFSWGAYLSVWGHAIGIGYHNDRWFIMDPNAGLYAYRFVDKFKTDVSGFVEARRVRKHAPGYATFLFWFYRPGG